MKDKLAFPFNEVNAHEGLYEQHFGMTLRDYFAAHAPPPKIDMTLQEHCAYRWRYADAMLAAREAK